MTQHLDKVDEVEVSASRKIQLEQYEPIEAYVGLTATVPEEADADAVAEELSDYAMEEAERAAMRRHEEYVREEAFGDG